MSGIVGIINLDGAPVDRELLGRMTDFMSFRGPDAQEIWIDGNVGFGHTMLRTTFEAETEKQPLTLDGRVWLTADARIDGRGELIAELEGKLRRRLRVPVASNGHSSFSTGHGYGSNGHNSESNGHGSDTRIPNDAELILYAYEAWGEDCVKHLIGDFAFAIWDSRERRLFCARDHFGVKPFYYAHVGNTFIFSNTLNCVRQHPMVSSKLDDAAIGDFLLFDSNQDPATTTFVDIQRLAPAHSMLWLKSGLQVKRYWTLSLDQRIIYKKGTEYVERFKELLRMAVADRLRTKNLSISMSGGLDSTSVAATALELLSKLGVPFEMVGSSVVNDTLIPDEERYYSGLAAEALGIPLQYLVADDYKLYERGGQPELRRPEPVHGLQLAMLVDHLKQFSTHGRVVLTGWDGDAILNESPRPYFIALLKGLQFQRLVPDLRWYLVSQRSRLKLSRFGNRLKRLLKKRPQFPTRNYPNWLNQDFAKKFSLAERWEEMTGASPSRHATRPQSYSVLTSPPNWLDLFESYDPGVSLFHIEARHPFLDLRLVEYCLAVPAVPWCFNKELLRESMRGILPENVRKRPKTALAGWAYVELLQHPDAQWVDEFVPVPELAKYIERAVIPRVFSEFDPWKAWINLRPLSLNYWLRDLEP